MLGESPTKAQWEELGLTPASATIMRTLGGWNAAKERAGLKTFDRGATGERPIRPKRDGVEVPADVEREPLTSRQRWCHENRRERIERKDRRRAEIRRWLYEYEVRNCECARYDGDRPPCLGLHHPNEKEPSIATMVGNGHSKASFRAESARCIVLRGDCHRLDHLSEPDGATTKS